MEIEEEIEEGLEEETEEEEVPAEVAEEETEEVVGAEGGEEGVAEGEEAEINSSRAAQTTLGSTPLSRYLWRDSPSMQRSPNWSSTSPQRAK